VKTSFFDDVESRFANFSIDDFLPDAGSEPSGVLGAGRGVTGGDVGGDVLLEKDVAGDFRVNMVSERREFLENDMFTSREGSVFTEVSVACRADLSSEVVVANHDERRPELAVLWSELRRTEPKLK